MPVAVSRRRTPGHGQRVQIVFPTGSAAPGLMHDCTLGAGVRVRVNAANPGQWQVIWVDAWNDHARPLLKALIGPGAVQQLDSWSDSQRGPGADLDWIGSDWAGQHPEGSATSGWDDQILGTGADALAASTLEPRNRGCAWPPWMFSTAGCTSRSIRLSSTPSVVWRVSTRPGPLKRAGPKRRPGRCSAPSPRGVVGVCCLSWPSRPQPAPGAGESAQGPERPNRGLPRAGR